MSTFARRIVVLAVGVAVLGLGAVTFVLIRSAVADDETATISLVQTVEADVTGELDATWERFSSGFPARMSCIDDVSVELVRWIRDADSAYLAGAGRIEIRAPVEPERFRDLLVRELAEHVEYTCDDIDDLRAELGPSVDQFPDAVVELVNGTDQGVDDQVVATVAAWGLADPPD